MFFFFNACSLKFCIPLHLQKCRERARHCRALFSAPPCLTRCIQGFPPPHVRRPLQGLPVQLPPARLPPAPGGLRDEAVAPFKFPRAGSERCQLGEGIIPHALQERARHGADRRHVPRGTQLWLRSWDGMAAALPEDHLCPEPQRTPRGGGAANPDHRPRAAQRQPPVQVGQRCSSSPVHSTYVPSRNVLQLPYHPQETAPS